MYDRRNPRLLHQSLRHLADSLTARPAIIAMAHPARHPTQRRSEFLQIALAILTLILVAAEWTTQSMIHRVS
jgi:hypothetical protein